MKSVPARNLRREVTARCSHINVAQAYGDVRRVVSHNSKPRNAASRDRQREVGRTCGRGDACGRNQRHLKLALSADDTIPPRCREVANQSERCSNGETAPRILTENVAVGESRRVELKVIEAIHDVPILKVPSALPSSRSGVAAECVNFQALSLERPSRNMRPPPSAMSTVPATVKFSKSSSE